MLRWTPLTRSFSVHIPTKAPRVTIGSIRSKFEDNQKLTMITAYDYSFAKLAHKTGIDMILVGDSLGMTMLGQKVGTLPILTYLQDTRKVTVDQMVHHCQAVVAGAGESKFIVGDMPFGSYEASDELAVATAVRLLKEGGAEAVKLEGGERMASRVRAIVAAGIPVMGHIGLTPQTASALGGFKVVFFLFYFCPFPLPYTFSFQPSQLVSSEPIFHIAYPPNNPSQSPTIPKQPQP